PPRPPLFPYTTLFRSADAEDRLRHDSQGPLRSEEERREVRELSAGIGLGCGLEQAAIRKDDLEARNRVADTPAPETSEPGAPGIDRKSTRLNSSHLVI